MLRALARLFGFLALAGAFVALVLDGVRFIATGALSCAPLGVGIAALAPERYAAIEPLITRHVHPLLWSLIVGPLLSAPAGLILGAVGVVLMWAGRGRKPAIGFAPR